MVAYVFEDGSPVAIQNAGEADPQAIGEALEAIASSAGGHLTPAAVVDAARDPDCPLHRHLLWDDQQAAEAYRRDQARALIRLVRISTAAKEPVRAWLSVRDPAIGGTSYRFAGEVQGNTQLQLLIMRQATRDLEAWEKRYRNLGDLCGRVAAIRSELEGRIGERPEAAA